MAKLMLTAHSNGRTGSVGGLLNLGGADLKEVVNPQVYSQDQNAPKGFWKGVFQLGRVAVHPYTSPIVPLVNPVLPIVEIGSRLCKAPNSSEGQPDCSCQTEFLHPSQINKAPSNLFASRGFPQLGCTSQNMALVEKWKNTQATTGMCACKNPMWFEGSATDGSDLSKLTAKPKLGTQEGLQGSCTALASCPSVLTKFADEDQNPQEPVDSWEELHDTSAVQETVATGECLHSLALCESMQSCSETAPKADGQMCSDRPQELLQSANALQGDACQEFKTLHSDSSKNCSLKPEHSDLTYVLFDRSGKYSGKSRKHRRQSKQKSKQHSAKLDSMLDCFALAPVLEDPISDVPSAPCEKGKSSKSTRKKKSKNNDDFGCNLFDQGLSFSGLGDFLPGCQKSGQTASFPACPRIPDLQAESVPVPSKKIRELNRAWGINPKKPGQVPPKEKSKVSFAEGRDLVTTHLQVAWGFAYRAARVGTWHLCHVDQQRFQERVARIGQDVEWVLAPEHRAAVYNERFSFDD